MLEDIKSGKNRMTGGGGGGGEMYNNNHMG